MGKPSDSNPEIRPLVVFRCNNSKRLRDGGPRPGKTRPRPPRSTRHKPPTLTLTRHPQRRRERGRRSQAAFRKRQAQASKDLADENQRLKEAIRRVVAASRTAGAAAQPELLLGTVHDLADAAGIDADEPNSDEPKSDDNVITETDGQKSDVDTSVRDFLQGYKQHFGVPRVRVDLDLDLDLDLDRGTPQQQQRLTDEIWPDPFHYTRISLPPGDIIPYLGPRSTTLAGLLFWSMVDHHCCRGDIKCRGVHSKPVTTIQRGLSHSNATRDIKPAFIQAMIEARWEYKRTGSIGPRYAAAAERDLSEVLHGQVQDDYCARGKDSRQWLSCVAIEERVRSIVGSVAFGLLERAASGRGDGVLCEMMDGVKCGLYDSSICFGDGPRWSIDVVDGLFLGCIGMVWRMI